MGDYKTMIYKVKLRGKLMYDTLEQLEDCKKIIELLKKKYNNEFDNFEEHFLLQYYDIYKDKKMKCRELVKKKLMRSLGVERILIKCIRKIRKDYERDWYGKNKKEWFDLFKKQ